MWLVALSLIKCFFPDSEENYLFGRNFYPWKYFRIKDEKTHDCLNYILHIVKLSQYHHCSVYSEIFSIIV